MRDSPLVANRLRVIAGELGGRRLVAPANSRPTTDRVREALFSALGAGRIEEAAVLDLYAGSGALAIEALSRGARVAVLVDQDRRAVEACRQNLEATELTERARVVALGVDVFLRTPPAEAPFALVFVDPPYEMADDVLSTTLGPLQTPGWLSADGAVVVERAKGSSPPTGWIVGWERTYGDTLVSIVHVAS